MKKLFLASLICASLLFAWSFKSIQVCSNDTILADAADTISLGRSLNGAVKIHAMFYIDTVGNLSSNLKMNVQVSPDNTNWVTFITAAAADSWITENTWTIDTTRWSNTSISTVGLFKYARVIFNGVYSNQKARLTYYLGMWY